MSESKSAPQITLEGRKTLKNSAKVIDLIWPAYDRMTCWMHEYYLVLHIHIHITSKNGDVCKLCATERFSTWHDHSYDVIGQMLGGQGLEIFRGDVKKMGGSYRKNGDIRLVNKKDI